MIAAYRDTRLRCVDAQTVVRELGLLRRLLNAAKNEFDIALPKNPVSAIRFPRATGARSRRLQGNEEQRLLAALGATPQINALVRLALETAMRRGELLGMQWSHIDLGARTLHIPKTKTGVPRTIPLTLRAVDVIKERSSSGAAVFNVAPNSVTQAFRRATRRASIPDMRFHDLRHEATSRLFEGGLNVMEVAAITGHEDLRMLKRYTHIKPTSLLGKLDERT